MSGAQKVFIGIPTHDGKVCAPLMTSVLAAISEGTAAGASFHLNLWQGDSLVQNARNALVATFMSDEFADYTDFLFVDSDMSWPAGQVSRILSHPVDFVGGTYRQKKDEERYNVGWIEGPNDKREGELVAVRRLPAGFFRMTRAGLKRVIAQCDYLKYKNHLLPDKACWYLYDVQLHDGVLVGEDYVFCDLIASLGETVWLDPTLSLDHIGTKVYVGNVDAFIVKCNRLELPADERRQREEKLIRFAEAFTTPHMQKVLRAAAGQIAEEKAA